ncbi:hypothetical protein A2859_06005 [Candidatus Roizmanbacteria bacterium RIFCSPHIGHO2_01_FULL_37_16b]|nr:MAG: hypothetical protein A2859_06005 [Candidatus Roizmanbacteria bacterium RIFCSPHIGHO2_01_FULL_37_16b]OGK31887.1 MAG: hypothetical protein A3F57_04045 [Candidatus Roizmanbacteria bacterium RIFCSPHIGHO2_12_FULL_36_11]
MKFRDIVILFLFFRAIDFLIAYLSQFFIPYLGFFPYKEIAENYNLPKFLTAFANFDGAHYLLIAKNGYAQYQQAFFPLYPLLIRWLSPLFLNNHLVTGLLISNLSFLVGLFIFKKYSDLVCHSEIGSESETRSRNKFGMTRDVTNYWPILFLVVFPTSFFFGAVYTEGLFFFLLVGCLYFLKKERFYLAGIFAFFASLTKLIGLFLIIFFILKLIRNWKLGIRNFKLILITLSPLLGLTIYSFYLWLTTRDPLFFLNSQWAFGANRSSSIILLPQVYFRYLKIFFTASWNFQYFISLFEFITFNFVLFFIVLDLIKNLKFKIKNYEVLGLGFFSFINLLLPTLTGTLSSIPRYALFSLSFFVYLSQIKNLLIKVAIATIFVIFHIIMLGFFIQGYFVS